MKKTTLDVTIVRLRLVQSDEPDFTDADEHPTLSGMRCAADVGVSSGPGLAKCKAEPKAFPFGKRRAK